MQRGQIPLIVLPKPGSALFTGLMRSTTDRALPRVAEEIPARQEDRPTHEQRGKLGYVQVPPDSLRGVFWLLENRMISHEHEAAVGESAV
jgi:hypothetical protein